ncbi:MAG: ATP-binding cassette domain-containing protein [Bdellovibrionales bacterium]|nr:ATP-binding cassette domain-containing protein [Bdellovibrionales bacterium]
MIKHESIEKLSFKSLDFEFSVQDRILLECDFEFPMNKVVAVQGNFGCGKSTILKLLATLIEPTAGEYWINDHLVNSMSFEELIPYRLKIGYGFDYGGLLNNKSLRENLMLPLQYHKLLSPEGINERIGELMEKFDLSFVGSHRPSSVSGSQRKLTCVLRALVMNPEMLILDNPTHGLNEKAVGLLIEEIQQRLASGELKHVFLVTDHKKMHEELIEQRVWVDGRKLSENVEAVSKGKSA